MRKKSFFSLGIFAFLCIVVFLEMIYIEKQKELQKGYALEAEQFYKKVLVPILPLEKTLSFEQYPYMQEWVVTQ